NFFDPQTHDLTHSRERERLKRASNSDFAIAHFSGQNFGRKFFFVELLAQLQVLDVVEKFDHFLVRAVAESAQESGCQEFATAFASNEINVKQVCGVELRLDPRTAIRNDSKAVKDFPVQVNGRFKGDTRRAV